MSPRRSGIGVWKRLFESRSQRLRRRPAKRHKRAGGSAHTKHHGVVSEWYLKFISMSMGHLIMNKIRPHFIARYYKESHTSWPSSEALIMADSSPGMNEHYCLDRTPFKGYNWPFQALTKHRTPGGNRSFEAAVAFSLAASTNTLHAVPTNETLSPSHVQSETRTR